MEELIKGLKRTVIGGYRREDVLLYIRDLLAHEQEQHESLQNELNTALAKSSLLEEHNRQLQAQVMRLTRTQKNQRTSVGGYEPQKVEDGYEKE